MTIKQALQILKMNGINTGADYERIVRSYQILEQEGKL
jgi:hypothetical protein